MKLQTPEELYAVINCLANTEGATIKIEIRKVVKGHVSDKGYFAKIEITAFTQHREGMKKRYFEMCTESFESEDACKHMLIDKLDIIQLERYIGHEQKILPTLITVDVLDGAKSFVSHSILPHNTPSH